MEKGPSKDEWKEALLYAPSSGLFYWRETGRLAGHLERNGYVRITFRGVRAQAHRIAWMVTHGDWPIDMIDHINGDKADNRIANLREATNQMNCQNRRYASRNNKLGVLGVHQLPSKSGFRAAIRIGKKMLHLGTFKTIEEASSAYVTAKRQLHPGGLL